jgi:hypothetical protein
MNKYIHIDPKYISSEFNFDGSKTTIKLTIDKEAISENAKRVHIAYMYVNEKSAAQPKPGTVQSVGTDIVIDKNTQFPITGEFEIDGTPNSINTIGYKNVTRYIYPEYKFGYRFYNPEIKDYSYINDNEDTQLEFLEYDYYSSITPGNLFGLGGIALRGTYIGDDNNEDGDN